ncbi:MAG: leucine-rich repeat protein [Treponemataceae bacterium]|nr:leucine-rich repeat protein [Treponemataceae bacterium]
MKRTVILLFGCIFALGIFSCKTSIEESPADDEDVCILVNGSEVTASLEAGQQYILRLSNGVSAAWAVDDASVAALSAASGVSVNLTAQAAGSVTVAATANGTAYTCALQITESGGGQNGGGSNAPNVSFINLSAYKVIVCRDGLGAEIATVEAGGTKSVYVSPGTNEITFHFRYSYCIIADDDSGMVWLDVADNGAYTYPVDSADVAAGAVQIRIPSPKNPQFGAAYLKVENQWNAPISLYNGNTQQKLYNKEKYYIQPGHSGVYSIQPDALFEGFKLGASPASATAVAPFYAESGVVYKCEFDGSGTAAVATESVRQRELYTVTFEADGGTEISPLETSLLNEPAMPAPEKQGYQFAGWYVDGECRQPVEYPYSVNADITLYAKWIESGDTAYTVKHYQQSADFESYTLAKTEPRTGTTGALTAAAALSYKGFTAKPFEQKPIAADGTTVVEIYYARSEYTVNHYQQNTDCQTYTLIRTELLTGTLDAPTAAKAGVYEGFTARPFGQKTIAENGTTVIDIYYDRNAYTYTVNHYQQNTDCQTYTLAKTETLTGMMGTMTAAKICAYKGFTAKSFEQKLIPTDSNIVIDIYYSRNTYTVLFNSNNETENTTTQVFYYGVPQKLNENIFSYFRYTFIGWALSESSDIVYADQAEFCGEYTSDVTLYAKWFYGIIATADTVGSIDLTGITGEYTIKVVGDISQGTLTTLAGKMKYKKNLLINLDLSEAVLETIDSSSLGIFYACPLYSIVLPETLKTVGRYALSHCDNLKSVEITGVETIGEWAFYNCDNLESVKIDGAETVGDCAFYDCGNLKTVVLKNITTIGSSVFKSCKSLSSIIIDAETIGYYAFQNCTSLTSVIIGKNVRSIGSSSSMPCFAGCTALASVQFEDTENWYDSSGQLLDVTDAQENARRLKDDSAKPWVKK